MTSPLPPLAQATSGALGGVISNALVFPLDTITSRLQTSSRSARKRTTPAPPASPDKPKGGYASPVAAVRTILSQEGWSGLYAGLGPDSLSQFLSQFLYFFVYSALREGLMKRKLRRGEGVKVASSSSSGGKEGTRPAPPLLSALEELAIGCLAGICAKGVVSPLSMITVRAQTSREAKGDVEGGEEGDAELVDAGAVKGVDGKVKREEKRRGGTPSAMAIAQEIYREQGVGGFWSGFQSTVFLTLNPAITYYAFSALQRALIPAKRRQHPTPAQTFFCGALASAVASALTYPLILAKTRLQFRSPTGRALYTSQLDVFRKTVQEHGLGGLYAGVYAQLLKGFFSSGIQLLVKDRLELLIVLAHRILTRQQSRAGMVAA